MTHSQTPTDQELVRCATKLAGKAGLDWSFIANQCAELVVFGSQAAGLQTPSSDLDLLVVTKDVFAAPLPHFRGIDLVFRTEEEMLSADWLKTELAGHIAIYGRWLQGRGQWRSEALAARGKYDDAAEAKRRRISRLVEALCNHWGRLTPDFRRRNLTTLRREKQRLQLLQSGKAVPPTRLLDMWADQESARNCCGERALSSGGLPQILQELFEASQSVWHPRNAGKSRPS
jgi:hypothetical protein